MSPYDWSYMQKQKKQTLTQRVKKIEKDIRQMSVVLDSHGTDLYHIRNSDPKPYTAMRSTGGKTESEVVEAIKRHNEPEYCECTATITHYHKDDSGWWVCDKCGKPSSEKPNLTKPQEYCECKDLLQCNDVNCPNAKYQHCARCDKPYKPIKSQEDIRKQIIAIYEDLECGLEGVCKEHRPKAIKIADRILAIVKGE